MNRLVLEDEGARALGRKPAGFLPVPSAPPSQCLYVNELGILSSEAVLRFIHGFLGPRSQGPRKMDLQRPEA